MTKEKNIPIKIKNSSQSTPADIKKALNLNFISAQAGAPLKKSRFWLATTLVFVLISMALAFGLWWVIQSIGFSQYQKLTPSQAQAAIFLKVSKIKNLSPSMLPDLKLNSSFINWLQERLNEFLTNADLTAQSDIAPLLKDDFAIFIMKSSNQGPVWTALFETKPDLAQQKQVVVKKIEEGLRQSFGINQMFYRQAKITIVSPLHQPEKNYYYTQVDNFILASNDLSGLENLIDRVLKNGIIQNLPF